LGGWLIKNKHSNISLKRNNFNVKKEREINHGQIKLENNPAWLRTDEYQENFN
jgi:hypothetical protein